MERDASHHPASSSHTIRLAAASTQRVQGTVRLFLRDQGDGYITVKGRDYHFSVTDVVSAAQPMEGDPVSFVPQLHHGHYRARQISIERQVAANDPFQNAQRSARGPRPMSIAPPAAVMTKSPAPLKGQPVRERVRCGGCERLVMPRIVPVKSGLKGGQSWRTICPSCKRSMDGGSSQKLLWNALVLVVVSCSAWYGYEFLL